MGQIKNCHLRQVISVKRFNAYDIFYNGGGKGRPLSTDECLIELTAWACLAIYKKNCIIFLGCKRTNALDLVFALDSSTSLSPQDFEVAKQFVRSIVDSFQIGPAKTQVGLLKFSTTVNGEFMLNQYSTSGAIKKAIDGVQYKSGGTHTDEAIAYAVNNMFTPAGGARSGSSKVHTVLIGVRVIVFNATFNNIC